MVSGARVIDTRDVNDVTHLYVVQQENPLYQGDEPFYALVVGAAVWVIPHFTAGLTELLAAVRPPLERRRGVVSVQDARLPWSWRRRLLGVLPLFPIPSLGSYPLSSLPRWSQNEGHAPSEYPELFERGV